MPTRTSDCVEIRVIRSLCKRIRSDYAKAVQATVLSSSYIDDLPELDPSTYTDSNSFALDLCIYSFLKKWKGWKTKVRPKDRAFAAWLAAEHQCAKTNERIPHLVRDDSRALKLISEVQRKIQSVLGSSPGSDVFDECKWGNGATSSLRRSEATIAQKQTSLLSITPLALPIFLDITEGDIWVKEVLPGYSYAECNRGVMVPKNAKVDRPIAAEPTGNSFLQQGVGRYIRRRLKAFGVDLNDQSINQSLAFAALVDGLATIDLSSASDTLALEVVRLLLPPAWFDLLYALRSPKTRFNGKVYLLEKFSSMGNAFTFELESLIFWAISETVVKLKKTPGRNNTVSVYGDDIIVPAYLAPEVVGALHLFGFQVNWEKSFLSGSFYESCGRQYFELEDVTPPYQKEVVGSDLSELIKLHNRLYRWGQRGYMKYVLDSLALIESFIKTKHPKLKTMPRIPLGSVDDRGLLTSGLKQNQNGDYSCTVLAEIPVVMHLIRQNELLGLYSYKLRRGRCFLNELPDGSPGETINMRTRIVKTRVWASSLSGT